MLRKLFCLVVLVCAGSLAAAQTKDKDKDKKDDKKDAGIKAVLVKADVDRKLLIVTIDGKKMEFPVTRDVKFIGPRGGISDDDLKDDRLTVGAELKLVLDGKTLKEVHLPYRKKDKDKDKDKK
jgi:hypothetical protein